ncbi:hypothetical protein [Aliivibrio fischeri]|uniref:hypothetical protein n=1 Tax=Aliivibrio fischeri TaxID=668 RepID=UPI00080DD517|nr:hypothetical protein [Aliivibrio fischeri]OCH48167.1 hypothetical protein A6E02_08550 [Aliivibrio fischeri]
MNSKTPIEVNYLLNEQYSNHDYGKLTIAYLDKQKLIVAMDDQFSDKQVNNKFKVNVLTNDIIPNDYTIISCVLVKDNSIKTDGNYIGFNPLSDFFYSKPYQFGYTISSNNHYDDAVINFSNSIINISSIMPEEIFLQPILNL